MANSENLNLKRLDEPKASTNFNHQIYYQNNFDKIDAAVGAKPADLTTTAKTIIPAINELKSDKAEKTDVGLLSGLLTTAKTSIVNAINELFNNKANKALESLLTPTLENAWVEVSSFLRPKFYKNNFGEVRLIGKVKSGALHTTILTLPAGYRPPQTLNFPVSVGNSFGNVYITSTGLVVLNAGGAGELSLDNISFRAV